MSRKPWTLRDFMAESLRIEGIHRTPTDEEMEATERFLGLDRPMVSDMSNLVGVYAPGKALRTRIGMNVRVGDHIAPPGGPHIFEALDDLLTRCAKPGLTAWDAHVEYETLHPFMDGNGRSGRTLWLWMRGGHAPIGFLHQFYYETLSNSRRLMRAAA